MNHNTMRKVAAFVSVLLVIMFVSCDNNSMTERVTKTYDNGQPAKVGYFDKNNQCVHEKDYYENGALFMEGDIKDNLREGEWVSYFQDGKIQSKGFFEKDVRTGMSLVYYENGNLWMEGNYREGKRVGQWIYYDEQGYETQRVDFGD